LHINAKVSQHNAIIYYYTLIFLKFKYLYALHVNSDFNHISHPNFAVCLGTDTSGPVGNQTSS